MLQGLFCTTFAARAMLQGLCCTGSAAGGMPQGLCSHGALSLAHPAHPAMKPLHGFK